MKPQLIAKSISETNSISLSEHSFKTFLKMWHFHPQLELVISLESEGMRFVGDSIENFKPSDIVLIGKNLVLSSNSNSVEGAKEVSGRDWSDYKSLNLL